MAGGVLGRNEDIIERKFTLSSKLAHDDLVSDVRAVWLAMDDEL